MRRTLQTMRNCSADSAAAERTSSTPKVSRSELSGKQAMAGASPTVNDSCRHRQACRSGNAASSGRLDGSTRDLRWRCCPRAPGGLGSASAARVIHPPSGRWPRPAAATSLSTRRRGSRQELSIAKAGQVGQMVSNSGHGISRKFFLLLPGVDPLTVMERPGHSFIAGPAPAHSATRATTVPLRSRACPGSGRRRAQSRSRGAFARCAR